RTLDPSAPQFCLGPDLRHTTHAPRWSYSRRAGRPSSFRSHLMSTIPVSTPVSTRVSSPSFQALGVPDPLVRVLAEHGITEPFPIQSATLPDSLAGRDVLGRGRTGSGKTYAF